VQQLQSALPWIGIAYLVGAIPVGLLIAKIRGIDLRKTGSGNIGATNAVRALGPKLGLLVFIFDAGKAALPVFMAASIGRLAGDPPALAAVALFAVLGHIFPVYLKFKGGKGVACALGVYIALDPPIAAAALLMYLQGAWLTRISAVGSLTATSSMTLCVLIAGRPAAFQLLSVALMAIIWLRHIKNIREMIGDAKARKRERAQRK
jgi:glycerol-3-phosphate acyltransferase PlsY